MEYHYVQIVQTTVFPRLREPTAAPGLTLLGSYAYFKGKTASKRLPRMIEFSIGAA